MSRARCRSDCVVAISLEMRRCSASMQCHWTGRCGRLSRAFVRKLFEQGYSGEICLVDGRSARRRKKLGLR